jgi:AraC-like DNA-binding protein
MQEASERATLPGVYCLELVVLAARLGVRAEALLSGLPVTMELLKQPTTRLPLGLCAEIAERARRMTGQPGLAFYMGLQMRLSWHGFLGFAAMTAGSVREALELAEKFTVTRTTALGLGLYVEGGKASLVIEERVPLGALREFAVLSLIVGLWQIGQTLTGKRLGGVGECSFAAPPYIASFENVTAGVLRFSQPANRLVFDAEVLELPLITADPVAMQLARAQCERELAMLVEGGSFVARVRGAVGDGFRGLEEVAKRLRISTRTLKRRLAEHGTTFSQVVEELRHQRALVLLENQELSVAEVAERLGYTEVPNFGRAFRRWTGMTPVAFRRGRK